jgi:hypothetical protein
VKRPRIEKCHLEKARLQPLTASDAKAHWPDTFLAYLRHSIVCAEIWKVSQSVLPMC